MSSGAVNSRLVALLVIIVLCIHVSAVKANDLCQQFKSGRATIALLTPTRDGKFLLLDDHFRGYHLPEGHFFIESGLEPPWLNLTAQSPIQVDVGQETPQPTNGRGVFYFTRDNKKSKIETYLGVLWSNLTNMTIVPLRPPGPATIRQCQLDDYITSQVIPNIFFIEVNNFGNELYRPTFTRDKLHAVIPSGTYLSDRLVKFYSKFRIKSPYNLTSIDGGFVDNFRGSYGFSNCAKAIFELHSNKKDKQKKRALRLDDFILCSATEMPPSSFILETDIVPAECYHPEPELTYPPKLVVKATEALIKKLVKIYFVVYILGTIAISLYIFFRAKPSPAAAGSRRGGRPKGTSRHSSRTSTSTSKRGRSRSGGARRSSRTKSTKR